ncbi:MAG: S1C family serine protease [Chitinophagales bacterium]
MKSIYILLLSLFNILALNAQTINTTNSNSDLPFQQFLSGVNAAIINLPSAAQQQVDEGNNMIVNQLENYLRQLGINNVAITTNQKQTLFNKVPSYCDIVTVKVDMRPNGESFTNHSLEFISCLGDTFVFSSPDARVNKSNTTLQELNNLWIQMHNQPVTYRAEYRLNMPKAKMTPYNEVGLDIRLNASVDPIEGKYEKVLDTHSNRSAYRIGVIKNKKNSYDVVYLSGATNYKDWTEGELMGEINPKGSNDYYTATWRRPNKIASLNAFVSLDENNMLILSFKGDNNNYKYFKILNTEESTSDIVKKSDLIISSGTSFAISRSGYLLTSYHLIKKASKIDVEINGIKYESIVVTKDQVNDLAIIKIEDPSFRGFREIPYVLKSQTSEVGEKVFTLGYPMSSTMGSEIKLSNGIISSLSGYKGNLALYQIGMSIYGGNSGGPLFDENGALIGIIKARHNDTETASYAIKARNAMNLIDILGSETDFPRENKLAGLPLTEQVKIVREFVFQVNVYQ